MKPKIHKGHGSGMLIASLQALLSKSNSLEISQFLRSLLTDSSQVSLGLPLPIFTLSTRFSTPLRTGACYENGYEKEFLARQRFTVTETMLLGYS